MFGEEKITRKEFDNRMMQYSKDLDFLTHEIRKKANSPEMMSISNCSPIEVRIELDKILKELYTLKFPGKYEIEKEYNKVFITEMRLQETHHPITDTVIENSFRRIYNVIDKHRNKVRVELKEEDLIILIESNK